MTKPNSLGAALTAVSMIAIVAGCAGPGSSRPRSASIFGGKVDTANIGLATRAQIALASNDIAGATSLAERAVDQSPKDAGFRALLGNCYLAAGRFASAEAAYRDSLTLVSNQPQTILKLALVQVAQGKKGEAIAVLAAGQSMLDSADLGLALTLAGDTQSALQVLDPAARTVGADSRTRQNLALAHAFSGNWEQARLVASQDLAPDLVDGRIEQWMALAKPARSSDQVAAFLGVQPAAADPGQPIRLALNKEDAKLRQANAEPVAAPEAPAEPVAVAMSDAPSESAASVTVRLPDPVAVASAEPAPTVSPAVAEAASAPSAVTPAVSISDARPALSPAAVRLTPSISSLRRNAVAAQPRSGRSRSVVQIGSFSSRDRVAGAWTKFSAQHAALRSYTPVSARFAGSRGVFYRLSVKGFASDREAVSLCASVKRAGGSCFVRAAFNDAPVQLASR